METLVALIQQLVLLGKFKINVEYTDDENNVIGTDSQLINLEEAYLNILKSFVGLLKYNEFILNINRLKQQFNIPLLTVPIRLKFVLQAIDNISDLLNPAVSVPELIANAYFDVITSQSIVEITINNPSLGYIYDIQYKYDSTENIDVTTIHILSNKIKIEVIPNKELYIRLRAKLFNSVSEYSNWIYVLTARDTTPPAKPIVVENKLTYLGTYIELEPFTDKDFDYCYITFQLDGQQYTFKSNSNVLNIQLNRAYKDVQAVIYAIDTSGNVSEPTTVSISLLLFSELEQTIHEKILNNELQVSLLNSTVSIKDTIQSVNGNQFTLGSLNLSNLKAGFICAVTHGDSIYEYVITLVDPQTRTITVFLPNIVASAGDEITIILPVYGQLEILNTMQNKINNTVSKLVDTKIERLITPPNSNVSGTKLIDNGFDFVQNKIDNRFIIVFEDSAGNKQVRKIVSVAQHEVTFDASITITPAKYTIYALSQFVLSNLTQDYDKFVTTVQNTSYVPIKTGNITSINTLSKKIIDSSSNFDSIQVGSVVKIKDGTYSWFYEVVAINGSELVLNSSLLLDKFNLGTLTYEIYRRENVILSLLTQTASAISTLVIDEMSGLSSQINQLADEISFRVVLKDPSGEKVSNTQLIISNGKIQADANSFEINGNLIVSGTLDLSKVRVQGGNTTIDGSGITIRQGKIQLGLNGGVYNTLINNDGSGHLASGKISWTSDGSFFIDATQGGQILILTDKFKLSDGTNLVNFTLDDGKFIFDGNIEIRNGIISFNSLDEQTKQKITELESAVNKYEIKLELLNGNILDHNTQSTVIRLRIFQKGVEINALDSNSTPSSNMFTYTWYATDKNGQTQELILYKDKPEVTLTRDDVLRKLKLECVLDIKQ